MKGVFKEAAAKKRVSVRWKQAAKRNMSARNGKKPTGGNANPLRQKTS